MVSTIPDPDHEQAAHGFNRSLCTKAKKEDMVSKPNPSYGRRRSTIRNNLDVGS
jgi:hypothetical protein